MAQSLFIVNFSGEYADEDLHGTLIDCSDIEGTSCFCSPEAESEISRRLSSVPGPAVHWIDTGDYHYVSKIFMDQIRTPFNLVLFDRHPDMLPPLFGSDILTCGDWVLKALEDNQMLRRALLVGTDPSLSYQIEGYGGRVETLPSSEAATAGELLSEFAGGLPVYISIDKDVLSPEYARTNWNQGNMTLDELSLGVMSLSGCGKVIGADVCGAITYSKGGGIEDFNINKLTNRALFPLLMSIL